MNDKELREQKKVGETKCGDNTTEGVIMKQQIPVEQLNELSEEQRARLIKPHWDEYLTIGQMIEFLGSSLKCIENIDTKPTVVLYPSLELKEIIFEDNELADALWKACREVLEE